MVPPWLLKFINGELSYSPCIIFADITKASWFIKFNTIVSDIIYHFPSNVWALEGKTVSLSSNLVPLFLELVWQPKSPAQNLQ